ncbi:hypothetical protein Dsin_016822 [Dipteronia sinensis]|uniref:Uncharacterized protein n=1 Tax=Dipteronia sinensis TaxID=43782 RepID=A0AAE0AEF9_9ROSI|nr:hypothetical protein Dsin_016822 [Dipteronia sinensis]
MEIAHCTVNINNQSSTIETLIGNNFKRWKGDVEISLGLLGIDKALKDEEPLKPTVKSTVEQNAKYEKWEKANSLSLKIIRRSISESLKDAMRLCVRLKLQKSFLMKQS